MDLVRLNSKSRKIRESLSVTWVKDKPEWLLLQHSDKFGDESSRTIPDDNNIIYVASKKVAILSKVIIAMKVMLFP